MSRIQAHRYHDICYGHRVVGQGGKCEHLHGHNGRFHFTVQSDSEKQTDDVGRVMDFGVIKSSLCMWIEYNWDHKFLVWDEDPFCSFLKDIDSEGTIYVPFNPTSENMAKYLVESIGPAVLAGTGVILTKVLMEETAKCSASYTKEGYYD